MCKTKNSIKVKTLLVALIFLSASYIFEYLNNELSFSGILYRNDNIVKHSKYVDENTQFFIGSLSKQITAYLVVKYVDDIDLYVTDILNEDKLEEIKSSSRLFSNAINMNTLDGVQIKHLLTHSSGVDFAKNVKHAHPGQVFRYDNCNYIIAGKILEYISKKSFITLCSNFFEELGLKNTFLISDSTYLDLYKSNPDLRASMDLSFPNNPQIKGKWTGGSFCGGVISSSSELCKIIKFLYSKENIKKMLEYTVHTNIPKISYGLGFYINKKSGLIFHDCILPVSTFYYVGYFLYSLIDEQYELRLENVYRNVSQRILYMYCQKHLSQAIKNFLNDKKIKQ